MKTTVPRDALNATIRNVLNAVNSKATLPVLANILLEADENGLTVAATDLEVYVKCRLDAVTEVQGSTTLPAKKFAQIVGALPEGDVALETDDNQKTRISCAKARFRMVGMAADDFPREEATQGEWSITVPANELKGALAKVSYAASTDETRHVLNGTLLSVRGGVFTAVATDGRRLALIERQIGAESEVECDAILPPKVVDELVKVLVGDVPITVDLSESRASFSFGNTLIVSKLVEGSYPNYRQVIPGNFTQSAVLPREACRTVLSRVAMVISDNSASVSVALKKAEATISATSSEVGEGSEPFEVSYDGEELAISFNPQFLMDPLNHLEADQVVLQFNDQYSPMAISGDEGFLYIIMPMRS
jgi:DNA polymerase-3 subunit beta